MNWSADGKVPWGPLDPNWSSEIPVVVYRTINDYYCFDAIFSSELKAQLAASNKTLVTVEYDVFRFRAFGLKRPYDIRSVDGMVFNDGLRNIRPDSGYGMRSWGRGSDCRR
jgi:hypothetical protein